MGLYSNLAEGTGCILLSSTSASLKTLFGAHTRRFWVHLVNGNGKEEVSLYCKDLGQIYCRAWMLREEILYFYYFQDKSTLSLVGLRFTNSLTSLTSLITSVTSIRVRALVLRQHGSTGKVVSRKNRLQYLFILVSFWHFPLTPFLNSLCLEIIPGPSGHLGKQEVN